MVGGAKLLHDGRRFFIPGTLLAGGGVWNKFEGKVIRFIQPLGEAVDAIGHPGFMPFSHRDDAYWQGRNSQDRYCGPSGPTVAWRQRHFTVLDPMQKSA